jgi:hypothetical protein
MREGELRTGGAKTQVRWLAIVVGVAVVALVVYLLVR